MITNKKKLPLLMFASVFSVVGCSPNATVPTIDPSRMIEVANNYIAENKDSVNNSLKPTFHLSPLIGWMNDPNGFSEFGGKYHLYYQYYPYDAVWGSMHWGHQSTTDFVSWNHESVALAPDHTYDREGCFSGTAIQEDGKQYVAYTSVSGGKQNQSIAFSYDGNTFEKLEANPVISGKDLPEGFVNEDFRDPKIFKINNKYFIFCGNRDTKGNKQIICFTSDSIESGWKYLGIVYSSVNVGGIFECPDFISFDDKDVLIASPQRIGRSHEYHYQNDDSCVYKVGNFNPSTGRLVYRGDEPLEEFDKGFSFYAPQTMTTSDGRRILTAWMKSWSESNITRSHRWAGSMVLPRELTLVDDHIYQAPIRELANYFTNHQTHDDVELNNSALDLESFKGRTSSISLEIDVSNNPSEAGIEVYKNENESTKIYYSSREGCVIFDRSNCGSILNDTRKAKVDPINGKIKLQIILDVSSCEVFINDGYYTMTGNIFASENHDNVTIYCNGKASFSRLSFDNIDVNND